MKKLLFKLFGETNGIMFILYFAWIFVIAFWATAIYVAWHFITKYW